MFNQNISKLSSAAFRCDWQNVENSQLKLNFDVIIREFNLTGNFCLIHWQAKPKFLRRWGCYSSSSDQYYSSDHDNLKFVDSFIINPLQLDESKFFTVPTAVLYLPNSEVFVNNSQFIIRGV
jgi:hypothetical protein